MCLLELLYRLQNSNTSLLFWNLFTGLKFLNRIEYKIISLTYKIRPINTTQPLSHDLVSIQPLAVTTHALHLMLLWSSISMSLIDRSLPTSLIIPHPNYSSPSRRPSFEHAGLTCYTLLLPLVAFHCFIQAQNLPFQKILSSTLVCFCLSDWSHMALDHSPDLIIAHRF